MSMNISLPVIYTIENVKEFIEETESIIDFEQDILRPHPARVKLRILQELYDIYSFAVPCAKAIEEFREVLSRSKSLDSKSVRGWVLDYYPFYKQHLTLFGHRYQDENELHDGNFYLSEFNLYVDREPFIPIIQFWYLMNNLYWGQYHIPIEERKFEELSPDDYYYKVQDPNTPSDLEVIKRILQLK